MSSAVFKSTSSSEAGGRSFTSRTSAPPTGIIPYFPEFHLAAWFRERREEDVTIWCFQKTGARPLLHNYRQLVEHLSVDSLIRGGETGTELDITYAHILENIAKLTTTGGFLARAP